MPPLKKYVFENESCRIQITIHAYDFESAKRIFKSTVKDESKFRIAF